MLTWLKKRSRHKADSRFLELFTEWFDERFSRADWTDEEVRQLRFYCETWWLKGQTEAYRERWF
jgi:hypothetical protein